MIFYTITKHRWSVAREEFVFDSCSDALTLEQVRARLPKSEPWLYRIDKKREFRDGSIVTIGSINAEEFNGDVPDFK